MEETDERKIDPGCIDEVKRFVLVVEQGLEEEASFSMQGIVDLLEICLLEMKVD